MGRASKGSRMRRRFKKGKKVRSKISAKLLRRTQIIEEARLMEEE